VTGVRTAVVAAIVGALGLAGGAGAADVQIGPEGVFVVNGQPSFIVGLSDAPPPAAVTPWGGSAWAEVAGAGVRLYRYLPTRRWSPAIYPETTSWLDEAHSHGGLAWFGLRELARAQPGTSQELELHEVVTRFAAHPALGLWRGVDEPWWGGRTADSLAHAHTILKGLDPQTPMVTIQAARGTAADLAPYSSVTDVHGADPYPLTWRTRLDPDLHMVGRWTRLMRNITPTRSVIMTLGVCTRASSAPDGRYVLPTRRQTRYMVYDAIMNGARGLNFYGTHLPRCMSAADATAGWNWTYWIRSLRPVVRELAAEGPLHAALVQPWLEPGIRVRQRGFSVMGKRTATDLWVFVARHGVGKTARRTVRVVGLPPDVGSGTVYPSSSAVTTAAGAFETKLRRFSVLVVRFPLAGAS
jgi:hypothetical protein